MGFSPCPRTAVAVADAAAVVAVAFRLHVPSPQLRVPAITLDQFGEGFIAPLLRAIVRLLDRAELYGRSLLELRIGDVQTAVLYNSGNDDVRTAFPRNLPLGGDVSLPLAIDSPEVDALADKWRDDLGRALGLETLRG
jgi:hypothetical protein